MLKCIESPTNNNELKCQVNNKQLFVQIQQTTYDKMHLLINTQCHKYWSINTNYHKYYKRKQ